MDLYRFFDRESEADPDNKSLFLHRLQQRSRLEGEKPYIDLISDRNKWNSLPISIKKVLIKFIELKIGSSYKFIRFETYTCNNITNEVAKFVHLKTNYELNLVPGDNVITGKHVNTDDYLAFAVPTKPKAYAIKPFLIGVYPVSQEVWNVFDKIEGRLDYSPIRPVATVSWDSAVDWIHRTKSQLRLPDESEWEYACRAGTDTPFFWGDELDDNYCWSSRNSQDRTHDLIWNESRCNQFGLIDMCGNVFEWCENYWKDGIPEIKTEPLITRQQGADHEILRVTRGGGYLCDWYTWESTCRLGTKPDYEGIDIGFRLVRSIF